MKSGLVRDWTDEHVLGKQRYKPFLQGTETTVIGCISQDQHGTTQPPAHVHRVEGCFNCLHLDKGAAVHPLLYRTSALYE